MRRSVSALTFLFVVSVFLSSSFAQYPVTSKDFVAEGIIVAFHKNSRHRVMPYNGGFGTPAEFWIVRIDQWPDNAGALSDKRFILVEFVLYERNLTDCDINAKKLRFTLHLPEEDRHVDCLGSVPTNGPDDYLSKYERTIPGKGIEFPPFSKLPCLIADHAPVVLE